MRLFMSDITTDGFHVATDISKNVDVATNGFNVTINVTSNLNITAYGLYPVAVARNCNAVTVIDLKSVNVTFNLDVDVLLVFSETFPICHFFAINKELSVD